MNLFRKSEVQALESAAQACGLSLTQMMENAGQALAQEAQTRWGPLKSRPVAILCGKGNNGGDGFACARQLVQWGASCQVILVQGPPATALAKAAFAQLPPQVAVLDSQTASAAAWSALSAAWVIVDCVFGFGFRGQLSGDAASFLSFANAQSGHRIAADLPSGTECDSARAAEGAFRAEATVAFSVEKPAHRSYPAMEFCGQVAVRPVGIPEALLASVQTQASLTTEKQVREALPPIPLQAHKGSQGRLLLVCGSYGMAGACLMAARAALRCGLGLLEIAAERSIYSILAAGVPEAVFTVYDARDPASTEAKLKRALAQATACAVGCGLGELAALVCPMVFRSCKVPLLLDADALNYAARWGFPLASLLVPLVLTPHPGELSRLTGESVQTIQRGRLEAAQWAATANAAVVLLKGAATVVAGPEGRLALNSTGNPGLAKGGSGDVLAGVIGALLAQGVPAFQAAAAGAWLHGAAGDWCRENFSARAMLPTGLEGALTEIFKNFERQ